MSAVHATATENYICVEGTTKAQSHSENNNAVSSMLFEVMKFALKAWANATALVDWAVARG
jgi:hypothetical protein